MMRRWISLVVFEDYEDCGGILTVDHARSPASVISGVASSAIAFPSSSAISSDPTPLDSRNATFLSRGASRIVGSSRNREACFNSAALSTSCSSLTSSVESSAPGAGVVSACSSDDVSGAGDDGVVAEVRCHAGMLGLLDMSTRVDREREMCKRVTRWDMGKQSCPQTARK